MRTLVVNTFVYRFAVLLLSIVFVSTNTEGYASNLEPYQKHTSYKHSSLCDFSYTIQEVSESNEEESEINAHRYQITNHSFVSMVQITIQFESELIQIPFFFQTASFFANNLKGRAPPISA
ncbi:hypothetical protein [Leptospira jelokensis]|uniref:Uncharacterized protein n=1 Tax=Leptospira jelokensis TaxID=2484931 RepID=A0A4Z0ZT88_9LEPT|nr:hypothetical protein [Leptospira jelokensis]TGL65552.1 hypothetical protein EHQ62_13395 [Leptospira jelokensis]